jgi:hypothetical protein
LDVGVTERDDGVHCDRTEEEDEDGCRDEGACGTEDELWKLEKVGWDVPMNCKKSVLIDPTIIRVIRSPNVDARGVAILSTRYRPSVLTLRPNSCTHLD